MYAICRLLPLFENISRFGFYRFIKFAMHIYRHSTYLSGFKIYKYEKYKMKYNM
jgi:hypothetical protein